MVIWMKIKPILKTLWISLLSTFILVLSQTLTLRGFEDINTINLLFLEIPIEYFVINFLIYVMLTILFILTNDLIPFPKLAKGVVYSVMISVVWIALRFQPKALTNFSRYVFDSIVFVIPILIYGIFLGYLATEQTKKFKFEKKHLGFLLISAIWIMFHAFNLILSQPVKEHWFYYILWVIPTSLALGLVFGLIYEFSLTSERNSLYVTSAAVIVIFISYYAYQFAINRTADIQLFIRVLLDITSIILAIQFFEIFSNRFIKEVK